MKEQKEIIEYFNKKAERVNFIELKEYIDLSSLGLEGNEGLPLPLASDVLAEGISKGSLLEEVNVEMILDGMIYIIGTDDDFEYREDYMKILRQYAEKIDDYIFFKGIKYLDQNKEERASIYFRALRYMKEDHIAGRFNYGLALERIGEDFLNQEKALLAEVFLLGASHEFESILDLDEEYALAYYKLGYHYNYNNQKLKAKLMWEKYINLDDDELRVQEIREQIDSIEDDVLLETGLTYLSYNRFEDALDSFLKLLPRQENWWELRYLIGNTYAGLNRPEEAIREYRLALDLNDGIEDVYNELGIELFKLSRLEEALAVYNEAIEKLEDSYKLYFNRGLALIQLDNPIQGYEDIKKASELNPRDENVKEMMELIEKNFN